ncbi:hypothetical protein KSF_063100 [Reticulibacter mediterranei]|uniref:Uncharacterized protein n=1 Tax=Reticulibacter mediterranei TaxID=2778369 RepID=A0A8J3N2U1_9CHLR|nr:hypothetical protein [Reticulibacter mediterranei]GHO96262.1 hypothetical protein KSF_063100 [Reticulibacter mediterranei]
MKREDLEDATNLERDDIDPKLFAAALAIQHIGRLLAYGGSSNGRSSDEDALHPEHFERFVPRALENAQKTKHFKDHWRNLQQMLPYIKTAWMKGRNLFHEDLTCAMDNQEQMDYFSHIDFAVDCYAYISAKNTYPNNSMMQAWAINGYMVEWREHFLSDLQGENLADGSA